jgi:hypothetical protein
MRFKSTEQPTQSKKQNAIGGRSVHLALLSELETLTHGFFFAFSIL